MFFFLSFFYSFSPFSLIFSPSFLLFPFSPSLMCMATQNYNKTNYSKDIAYKSSMRQLTSKVKGQKAGMTLKRAKVSQQGPAFLLPKL